MSLQQVDQLVKGAGLTSHVGYAKTGAKAPYVVVRPMTILPDAAALCGQAIDWDANYGLYCVGGSVEASYNLAVLVMQALQGARVGGSTLSCDMGYVGSLQEGQYETQVTAQTYQGALS